METSACVSRMQVSVVVATIVIGRAAVVCAAGSTHSSTSLFWQSQAGVPNIGLHVDSPAAAGFLEGAFGRRLAGARWRHVVNTAWKRPDFFTRPRGGMGRDAGRGDDEEEGRREDAERVESGFSGAQGLDQAARSDLLEQANTGSGTNAMLGGITGRQSNQVSGSDQRHWTGDDGLRQAGEASQFSRQELQEIQRKSPGTRQSHYDESLSKAVRDFLNSVRVVEKTVKRKG